MKVILLKPVPKLGQPGEVVEVKPGYVRNFLLAKGLAREATASALADLERARQKREKEKVRREDRIGRVKHVLDGQTILIRAAANPAGVLFGGVDRAKIAEIIAKRKKIEIDHKNIILPHHLKKLGQHEVAVKIGGEEFKIFADIQREDKSSS